MDDNIYAAPEANLLNEDARSVDYYVTAPKKFLILFFVTFGLYSIYWFYKNWKLHKEKSGANIWPVVRAIFSIFFAHSLFRIIDEKIKSLGKTCNWKPGELATVYVTFSIAEQAFEGLGTRSLGSPFTDLISIIALIPIGWALFKAQLAVNIACDQPDGASNSRLSGANYVWIVLGTLFWMLACVGYYDMAFGILGLE